MSFLNRVTQRTIQQGSIANLQASLGRTQRLQEQLSSGRKLSRPSDDPQASQAALRLRSDLRRAEQYGRNANDGLARLGAADDALTSAGTLVRRAHDLLLAATGSSIGAAERQATAREIDGLRDTLLSLANTAHLGQPLFGGTAGGTAAFAADGTYLGNSGAAALIERSLAPGVTAQVNVDGLEVFGPDATGPGLFQALAAASQHLDANDQNALTADLTSVETAQTRLQDGMTKVGALYNRVDTLKDRASQSVQNLTSNLSDVEDIDLAQTIMELQLQQTSYQGALAATARVIQPSLADFLR
jgi:flagellar hook-associated protein 3 FlgL